MERQQLNLVLEDKVGTVCGFIKTCLQSNMVLRVLSLGTYWKWNCLDFRSSVF